MAVEFVVVNGRPRAVVRGTFDRRDTQAIRRKNVTDVELNRAKGFTGSLDILRALPELEGLHVLGTFDDLSPVCALKRLRRLQLESQDETPLDFSAWPHLEECFLVWREGSDSLLDCRSLERLYVYNFPHEDLSRLRHLDRLTHVHVGPARRMRTLSGADALPRLSHLAVSDGSKLISIAALGEARQLTELVLNTCRKVGGLDPLAACEGLRRLEVLNCGEIESLSPLAGLRELETFLFYESTRITDGDLTVLLDLPRLRHVSFANRRHYSHTREELTEIIAGRRG